MYRMMATTKEDRIVYGIEGMGERIEDLCTDSDLVESFVSRCNSGELASWQLFDVVEDFISEINM